jgi:hypothetical protein
MDAPDLENKNIDPIKRPSPFHGMIFYYGYTSVGLCWAECTEVKDDYIYGRELIRFMRNREMHHFHKYSHIATCIRLPGEPDCPSMPKRLWREWKGRDRFYKYDSSNKTYPDGEIQNSWNNQHYINNNYIYIPGKEEPLRSEGWTLVDLGNDSTDKVWTPEKLRNAHSASGVTHCVQCSGLLREYWGNIPPSCPKCEP